MNISEIPRNQRKNKSLIELEGIKAEDSHKYRTSRKRSAAIQLVRIGQGKVLMRHCKTLSMRLYGEFESSSNHPGPGHREVIRDI